mmetsp:Transcript_45969/g.53788  ORF Transcript_45969/g.53788 Transcript_45969/m.53788 type:complete len:245 (+) Transcript_45969:86-820(+)
MVASHAINTILPYFIVTVFGLSSSFSTGFCPSRWQRITSHATYADSIFGNRFTKRLKKIRGIGNGLDNIDDGETGNDPRKGEEDLDSKALQKRIDQQTNQYYNLFEGNITANVDKSDKVSIILFSKDTDDEGVHTIEYPVGSGKNILLAFESFDECSNYAHMLKDMEFFDPQPSRVELLGLETYCDQLGVPVKIVPIGFHLTPPTSVVEELSKNPELGNEKNMLEELFTVEDVSADDDFSSAWE